MKTSELDGSLLDYWVARVEGKGATICDFAAFGARCALTDSGGDVLDWYQPSADWAQGGPIIERERIAVLFGTNYDKPMEWLACMNCRAADGRVYDEYDSDPATIDGDFMQYGKSALQSAMRAFVAANFGDEVPDSRETGPKPV